MANQRGLISASAAPAAQPSTRASNYISNPLSHLPIGRRTYLVIQEAAVKLADKVEDLDLCPENMPPSLAAGVLAILIQSIKILEISNESIARVCEVSEGTLNKCLKKLELAVKAKQIEIPEFKNLE